jgi:hypothetical protein
VTVAEGVEGQAEGHRGQSRGEEDDVMLALAEQPACHEPEEGGDTGSDEERD